VFEAFYCNSLNANRDALVLYRRKARYARNALALKYARHLDASIMVGRPAAAAVTML